LRYAVAEGVVIKRGKKSCSGSASKSSRTGSSGLRVFEQFDDARIRAGADDAVDLGMSDCSSAPKRCESTRHDQLLIRTLALRVFEDDVGRLGFGRIDERTRVDHDRIGVVRVGNELPTGSTQLADHHLGVDEFFAQPSDTNETRCPRVWLAR